MNAEQITICEYANCEEIATEEWQLDGQPLFLCKECGIKYENSNDSGYCSQMCILGYGCDGSC